MFITNLMKIVGCLLMLFYEWISLVLLQAHFPPLPQYVTVLFAYAVVGLGAARTRRPSTASSLNCCRRDSWSSPNGWIEGLTVTSIILGVLLAGALVSPKVSTVLLSVDLPRIDTGIDSSAEAAILVIGAIYILAAAFNLFIPDTGARYRPQHTNPALLLADFWVCFKTCGATSWDRSPLP